MPTVPTEQNRVGIAGLTGEKLQPGDYSGTGLQALGTGLETLGATGRKVAVEQQARQDADDDYAIKAAWNDYAEQARTIRAAPPPDLDPEDAFNVTAQAYTDALGLARARLKNERQQKGFAHAIGPRFDADISSARAAADLGLAAGRAEQDDLIQRNARQDAIDHFRQPEIFAKYLETGAEAERLRSMRRGDDPTVTAALETAYRSSVHRGVIESLEQDPFAATTYYLRERAGMTERDRAAMDSSLKESLAQALAARDVDGILPARAPGEADAPLTPEERAAAAQKIESADWGEARKSYAREDLTRRGLGENQRRKQTASAAKAAALEAIGPLGLDFKSLTQLPGAIRRDLDEDTAAALARQAARNLDPAPVAPGGLPALRLNLMATYQPADFARQDLRLVRDLMAQTEYDTFIRRQQALGGYPPGSDAVTQQRIGEVAGQPSLFARGLAPDRTDAAFLLSRASYEPDAARSGAPLAEETVSSAPSLSSPTFVMEKAGRKRSAAGVSGAAITARNNSKERHGIYTKKDGKQYAGGQHVRSPEDQASNRVVISKDLRIPALMAYLSLISLTEGANGHYNYYQRYGGGKLKDLDKFYYGTKKKSDAAGMFQIQGNTYDEIALAKLGLNDFSPNTQNLIALFLMRDHGIRKDLLNNDIRGAIAKGADIWASLPDPKTNLSKKFKSGTNRLQRAEDIEKVIEMYERLKIIWERRLRSAKLKGN